MSRIDMSLIAAYIANAQIALDNQDSLHAQILIERLQELLKPSYVPVLPPVTLSVGVGLDAGLKRKSKPNEDFVFATTGTNQESGDTYGLFVVCDGMGGHANGRDASRMAVQAIVEALVPYLHRECVIASDLGSLLEDAVTNANNTIYAHNASLSDLQAQMGTTVTLAVIFGSHLFVANVGDSRTYLYRPGVGLRQVTRDHSHVASLVESGDIAPDDIYTHPQRNFIYRSLGHQTVEVDVFCEQIQDGDVLLLCSDGMWEMTRDNKIEALLASVLDASQMVEHLINLAIQGGGLDNIGVVICQVQMAISGMPTMLLPHPPAFAGV